MNMPKLPKIERKVIITISWRSYLYVLLLTLCTYLVSNAIFQHYKNKAFAGITFAIYFGTILASIFLVQREDEI